ncbi:MAG: T9SS type A sorting domain-containing protein [Paludibacter sp.]|nr:T9SS type A sorting domain-containing protein [Paludibacter sp.]
MKKYFIIFIVVFCIFTIDAQTVVRVRIPAQSEKALHVATLFNEALPTGVSIVMGVVGYEIDGGTAPYQYEWVKNNQVIATGEIAVIVPEKNMNYVLRVKDKNGCSVENAINVTSSAKVAKNYLSETVKINLTQFSNHLSVDFKSFVPENISVSIFDLQGKLHLKQAISESAIIPVQLPFGLYLVVVGNGQLYHVQKILVK